MTATMSWFKRNGGRDQLVPKEAPSSPAPHSSSSAKTSVFKALRIASLASRSNSSSTSSSFTSIRSPTTSSNSNGLPNASSGQSSLPLPSLSHAVSTSEHQITTPVASSSRLVHAARPSQDNSFAKPFHSGAPSSASASSSSSSPRVNFVEPSTKRSTNGKRRPAGASTATEAPRRRVLSNPGASGAEASEGASNVFPVAAGTSTDSNVTSRISSPSIATPIGPHPSSPSAGATDPGIRRRNTVSTAINTTPHPSFAAAAVTISNNPHRIDTHPTSTSSRILRPVLDISIDTPSQDKDRESRSSNELDHQHLSAARRPLSGPALPMGSPSAILETFRDWELNDSDLEGVPYGRGPEGDSSDQRHLSPRPFRSHGMQQQESSTGAGGQPRNVGVDRDRLPPPEQKRGVNRGSGVLGANVPSSPGDGNGNGHTDEDDETAPLQPPWKWGASTTTLQFASRHPGSDSEGGSSSTDTPTPGRSVAFSRPQSPVRRSITSPTASGPPLGFPPNNHQPHQQAPPREGPVEAVLPSSSPSKHSIGLPSWLGGSGSGGERTSQQHKRRSSNSILPSSPPLQSQGLASARSSSSLTSTGAGAAAGRPSSATSSLASLERRNSSRMGTSTAPVSFGSSRIGGTMSSSSTSSLGRTGAPTVVKKPSLMHSISLLDLHEKRQKQIQQLRDNNVIAPSVLGSNVGTGGGTGTNILFGAGSNTRATQFADTIMGGPLGGKRTPTPPTLRHASSFDPPKSTTSSSPASSLSNLPSCGTTATTGTSTTPTRSPGKLTISNLPPTSLPLCSTTSSPGIENPNVPASVFPMTGNAGALTAQRSLNNSPGRSPSQSSASATTTSTTNSDATRSSRSDSQSTTTTLSPISSISIGPGTSTENKQLKNDDDETAGDTHSARFGTGFGTAGLKAQPVAAGNQSSGIDLMASVSFGPPPPHTIWDTGKDSQQVHATEVGFKSSKPDLSYVATASGANDGRVVTPDFMLSENPMRNRSATVSAAVTPSSSAPTWNSRGQNDDHSENRARSATVASSSLISFLPSFDPAPAPLPESVSNPPVSFLGLGAVGGSSAANHSVKPLRRPSSSESPSVIPSLVKGNLGGLAVPSRPPSKTANSLPAPPRSRSARPSTASAPLGLSLTSPSDSATIRPSMNQTSRKVSSTSSLPTAPAPRPARSTTTLSSSKHTSPPASTLPGAGAGVVGLSLAPRRRHSNIQIRARKTTARSAASSGSGSASGDSNSSRLDTVTENSKAAQQLLAASSSASLRNKPSSDAMRTTSTTTFDNTNANPAGPSPVVVPVTRSLSLKQGKRRDPSFLEFESESDVTSSDDFLDLTDTRSSIDTRLGDQATIKATAF